MCVVILVLMLKLCCVLCITISFLVCCIELRIVGILSGETVCRLSILILWLFLVVIFVVLSIVVIIGLYAVMVMLWLGWMMWVWCSGGGFFLILFLV